MSLLNAGIASLRSELFWVSITKVSPNVMAWVNLCLLLLLRFTVKCYADGDIAGSGGLNAGASQEPQKLYLLSLLPYPPSQPSFGPYIFPGAQIAAEIINSRSDILKGYDLELIQGASGCSKEQDSLLSFVKEVFDSGKQIAGIIGPFCSDSAAFLSPVLNHKNIALVNIYLTVVPVLENGTRYPYTFGTSPSVDTLVTAAVELMRKNQWNDVVGLYNSSQRYFNGMYVSFEARLSKELNYQIVSSVPVVSFQEAINFIRSFNRRIIFLMVDQEETRRIVCFAWHEGIAYPKIQWIVFGMRTNEFRRSVQAGEYNCSGEQLIRALNNSFLIYFNQIDDNAGTDFISNPDFYQRYSTKVNELESNPMRNISKSDIVYNLALANFDAVLSMALALNNSIPALRGLNLSLEDYGYGNTEGTKAIAESILDLDFESVSGKIEFDNRTGFVLNRLTDIYQIQGNTSHAIGQYNVTQMTVRFNDSIQNVIGSNFTVVMVYVPIYVIVLHFGIMTILLCITVAVHVLSIVYRDFESIKASSPNLNHLAYAGLYLLFVDSIMEAIRSGFSIHEQAYTVLCNSNHLLYYTGLTLLLGTICAKTWRLFRIFVHYLDPGPLLSSRFLITFILILVTVDIVLSILWTAINPLQYQVPRTPANINISSADMNGRVSASARCDSENRIIWMGILTGYQVLLDFCAICLAFLTRHIKLKNFTTRGIALLSYFSVFVFFLWLPLSVILAITLRNVILDFVAYAVTIYVLAVLFLVFLFVPPVFPLLKQKVSQHVNPRNNITPSVTHLMCYIA